MDVNTNLYWGESECSLNIDKSDVVPGTYDIHVTRAEDKYWNELDTVLEDCLTITKQTALIQWSDLELTANQGDTLADIEKPAYLVSPLDGKQIPGTFYWIDDEGTSCLLYTSRCV